MKEPYKNILVAIDDSEHADMALDRAIQLADEFDSKLLIAHVIDEIYIYSPHGHIVEIEADIRPQIEVMLKKQQQKAYDAGVKNVEIIMVKGKPKVVIANDLVEENDIDLVVMGATGLSRIDKLLVGSTSEYVIRKANCEVLIVR